MADEKNNTTDQKMALKPLIDESKLVIHTIPDRFKPAKNTGGKNTGMFILLGGGVMLFLMMGALYYFLIYSDRAPSKESASPAEKSEVATPAPVPPAPVSSPSPVDPVATTTEPVASTSASSTIDNYNPEMDLSFASATAATSSEATTTPAEPTPAKGKDTDSDGMTDAEEMLLNTNPELADTDGDNYPDLDELRKLYNPAGRGKVTDANSTIYKRYTDPTYRYYLYLPAVSTPTSFQDGSVLFKVGATDFIKISREEDAGNAVLADWYKENQQLAEIDPALFITKKGWSAIKSADGFIVYLQKVGAVGIYVVNYNHGLNNMIEYPNIFDLAVNSLEIAK